MQSTSPIPTPRNEPVRSYTPGSPERASLVAEVKRQATDDPIEITGAFGRGRAPGSGDLRDVVMPSDHHHVLGQVRQATRADVAGAIDAALAAAPAWAATSFADRAAVFLRAADLLAGPWRDRLNAATMLGQGKTVQQAEIDSACELIDFLRFNVSFAEEIFAIQPQSAPGVWNRLDYRPLEGFVYAITPFNFTAIAGNLPTAPALLGNVVVWKPAASQLFSAHFLMDLFRAAGLPDGVIVMVPGPGPEVTDVVLSHRDLAGIHFTGSTEVFNGLWRGVADRIGSYRGYPRIVGETGGKDFVLAHPSADPDAVVTGLVRGAFEYSGQKCSAASRAYLPASLWGRLETELIARTEELLVGDVRDLANFTSAVIDQAAFKRVSGAIDRARDTASILVGGSYDDAEGWFIRPTIARTDDPQHELLTTEFFGPLLGVYVYDDTQPGAWSQVLDLVDGTSPYALTGAVFGNDVEALTLATSRLRNAAGNFYLNDKPTGAVVGQQPFGGARASGTDDKAGSLWNLARWLSPRAIKETFVPPTTIGYPHQQPE